MANPYRPSILPSPGPQFLCRLCSRPPAMASLHSLAPFSGAKEILMEYSTFLPDMDPFLSVSTQCLQTHFTWEPTVQPHLSELPKSFPPGNTQSPHSSQNQRGQQKPRDKTTTQPRQYQVSASSITGSPMPGA